MKRKLLMRKKTVCLFLTTIFAWLSLSAVSYGATSIINRKIPVTYRGIQVLVDGKAIAGVEPFIMDNKGIVMVPVRTVSEAVGKSVEWDAAKNIVYIGTASYTAPKAWEYTPPEKKIIKKVNYVTYRGIKIYAGGKTISGEEPFIHTSKGIVMVPIRAIAEATGKSVVWNSKHNTVEITTGKAAPAASVPKTSNSVWLEEMMVLRNIGPFFRQANEPYTIAAGNHKNGVAVRLKNGSAEIVVRTHGKYKSLEGWLGVDDETSNSSGAFTFAVFTDNGEVISNVEVESGAEKIIDRIPNELNYDYKLVEMETNSGDTEEGTKDSIYKTTYPVNSNLYEKKPIFISGPILPASYPKYISSGVIDISGALTVTFRVTWVAGSLGDYADLTAVLADFKFIK